MPTRSGQRIVLGIGDDAAAWRPSRSHLSVATTDMLVDGVHFLSDRMPARSIGHRAMAANLSDVAAMGARPVLATVALGVAQTTPSEWVLEAYRGMCALLGRFAARIAGGDIVSAPATSLSITLVGEVSPRRLKRRAGARPGDVLAATGAFGASRAGLEVVRGAGAGLQAAAARDAFERPSPRVAEGQWLAASQSVHALMDCSDGLALDLHRMATASACGASLQRVPVAPCVAEVAGDSVRALDWALYGGEDFELLVALAPRAFDHLAGRFAATFGRPLERLGRFTAERTFTLDLGGRRQQLPRAGWDHLRGGNASV